MPFASAPIYWDEEEEEFLVVWDQEIKNNARHITHWRFFRK